MTQNDTDFKWDKKRVKAASLVADDKLTDEEIAASIGVARVTLARWKTNSEFQARVAEIVETVRKKLLERGILNKQNRLDALNDRQKQMREVIKQRAEEYKDVPTGGNTGLLVKQTKGIGKGEDFQVVEEYAVDTPLLREMRETEKQAAIELGEWTEKRELKFDLSNLTDEELTALERITSKLT